jgi:hypothetical protein
MKKFAWGTIGVLCLFAVGAISCQKMNPIKDQEAGVESKPIDPPTPIPTVTNEVTIEVNSMSKPRIPFIKVPFGADPDDPSTMVRRVTFRTDTGEATIMVPVEAKVIYPNLKQVTPGARGTVFRVDQNGATLVITEQNEEEITVTYQILCDDGTTRYWAEGESPPRMQIPPTR